MVDLIYLLILQLMYIDKCKPKAEGEAVAPKVAEPVKKVAEAAKKPVETPAKPAEAPIFFRTCWPASTASRPCRCAAI